MQTIIKGIVTALVLSLFLSTSPKTAKADVPLTDAQLEHLVQTIVQKVLDNIKAKHEGEELPECEEYEHLEQLMLHWQEMREEIEENKLIDDPSFQFIH